MSQSTIRAMYHVAEFLFPDMCMRYHDLVRILSILVLWGFLTSGLALSVGAATLSMEAFLGFNEHFQLGSWTPLTLTLENRGRDITGTLEVIATSGSEFLQNISQSTYSADVGLPYNSKQLYAFSIKLNNFTHDLQIRFRQGDEVLLSRSISLRPAVTELPFVLVADEKASPDFLSGFPPQVFPVNVRPKFLPEHSYAYESVRMMILNIEILPMLRENQFQALLQWIKQGGYLLTSGGMNTGAFSGTRARQLFPLQIIGYREFTELRALENFCGQVFRSTSPFLLLHILSQDATVLLQEDDFPVLALREMERGRVLFSAFNYYAPAFRRWDGKHKFWNALLALHGPEKVADGPTLPLPDIQNALLSSLPAATPNSKILMLLVGLYLLLLHRSSRRIQHYRGQPWWNVGTLIVLMVFGIAGSSLLFWANSKKALSYNSFLHLHGRASFRQTDANYIAGLYTIQEDDYVLQFDSASYPISHLPATRAEGNLVQEYRVHQADGGQEVRGHSGDWRAQFFQLSTVRDFPLGVEANQGDAGLELVLRNDSEHTIQNCRVYIQQHVFRLENLLPGGEQRLHIPLEEIGETEEFDPGKFAREDTESPHTEKNDTQERPVTRYARKALHTLLAGRNIEPYTLVMQKKLLPEVLEAVHDRYQTRPELLCFVGWMDGDTIDMNIAQEASGESLTLITWEIPLQRNDR